MKDITACIYGINFYCLEKKITISSGYAIACHCGRCEKYENKLL